MNNMKNISVLLVAVLTTLSAVFGLLYNSWSLYAAHMPPMVALVKQQGNTYFYPVFYSMSGICVLCYVLLLVFGIDLLRGRLRWTRLLSGVLLFEAIYFLLDSIPFLVFSPTISKSIDAASGVANGGLSVQFMVFFPLWSPIVLWWARRQTNTSALVA